jgi:hypothetical protein
MLMDAFSALLVALPLLIPLAATFHINPFHLAVMFLLNLEIAYVTPPVGLNLFISSFRFSKPIVEVYRVVLPFVALLAFGLLAIIVVPSLSEFTVRADINELRERAAKDGVAPREAWLLECVQEDRNNLKPCSEVDIARWGKDGFGVAAIEDKPKDDKPKVEVEPSVDAGSDASNAFDEDALMKEMMGGSDVVDAGATDAGESAQDKPGDDMDELMKEMLNAGKDGG